MASRKHTAFAAMMCTSGPPCIPGKTTLSIAAANSCLLRIIPERGPRSVLCVVDVTMCACGTGDGCAAPGGNLAHAGEITGPRIGAAATNNQFGMLGCRKLFEFVVIDRLGFPGYAVRN